MPARWTLAAVVLALVAAGGAGALAAERRFVASDPAQLALVVTSAEGDVLSRIPLRDERFVVSYRNSIYGTLAEERYVVEPDGRFRLVQLAADQLAVLEEYYAVAGAPRRSSPDDRRVFVVEPDPDRAPVFRNLSIAATDLGERTLLVAGSAPVELWRLVGDDPTTVLHVEEAS